MSISVDAIREKREERVKALDALASDMLRLEGEIAAYDALLNDVTPSSNAGRDSNDAGQSAAPSKGTRKKPRKPPGTWEAIMRFIGHDARSVQELRDFASKQGVEIASDNMRSQMSNYRRQGYISRDNEPGMYSLTPEGKASFGISPEPDGTFNGLEAQHVAH